MGGEEHAYILVGEAFEFVRCEGFVVSVDMALSNGMDKIRKAKWSARSSGWRLPIFA